MLKEKKNVWLQNFKVPTQRKKENDLQGYILCQFQFTEKKKKKIIENYNLLKFIYNENKIKTIKDGYNLLKLLIH